MGEKDDKQEETEIGDPDQVNNHKTVKIKKLKKIKKKQDWMDGYVDRLAHVKTFYKSATKKTKNVMLPLSSLSHKKRVKTIQLE